jgi:ankyrin repeat protein
MKRYTASIWENKYNQLINNGCCLVSIVAAVLLVGCATRQQPKPPTAKSPDISIFNAAITGNIEAVKQHLAAGTDVNAKDGGGWTLLLQAVAGGHKEIVELLIDNGADVNGKTDEGWIPLSLAACESHKEIVELLISEGAEVNAKERAGRTPLNFASKKSIKDLLRKHGGKTGEQLKAEGK